MSHEPGAEYAGPVTVVAGAQSLEVRADLRGGFQPIDGRFHWYGRLAACPGLSSGVTVTVRTAHGSAEGRLSDVDPWGRLRVSGLGRPPF
ncbi:MAG: DUF4873 domain-containing protein [Nocardioides sp.]